MDPHQLRTWLSALLLVVAAIVVFHIVSEAAIIFGWLGTFLSIIAPFIWGFIIAYVLNIPRERFEALLEKVNNPFVQRRKRGLSVVATYISLLIIVFVVFWLVIPRVYANIVDFINNLPNLIGGLEEILDDLALPIDLSLVLDNISIEELFGYISIENITAAINAILSVTGSIFRAFLAIISSVYFLVSSERIRVFAKRVFRAVMSKDFYAGFVKYGREINTYFKRYIFCQVLDAVILGTIMTIAMSVMGVRHAFVLGPMLGFANLIPYFGSIFGTIVAIIVIMLTDGMQMGMIATVVLIVIQQFDANFIFPRLLGGSMKIPPLLVIIGIAVGNAFYGIPGMIMAIPIVTVLRNVIEDILIHIEAKKLGKSEEVRK